MPILWWLPWYTSKSDRIIQKSCRNLIQHYLGPYLVDKLSLDQLSVNIYNGFGRVCDLNFDCKALNEYGKRFNWPVEIVKGRMEDVTVSIPWTNLIENDSIIKVNGLDLTVHPKKREKRATPLSNHTVMSENKAQRQDEPQIDEAAAIFEECINTIWKRLKVKLENTKIRIELVPNDINRGIALDIHIKNIDFCDDHASTPVRIGTDGEFSKTYRPYSYINKKIIFDAVTLYTDEFP